MNTSSALVITAENLNQIIANRVAELLTPAVVEEIAEGHISDRVGQLTLEQAAKHLQCSNIRQLRDFCREHRIPILYFGPKKQFILLSDIRAAQERKKLKLAQKTTIERVASAPTERPAA